MVNHPSRSLVEQKKRSYEKRNVPYTRMSTPFRNCMRAALRYTTLAAQGCGESERADIASRYVRTGESGTRPMTIRCALVILVVAVFTAGCTATRAAAPPPPPPVERPLFEFHSGFWLNLHLGLHHAATARRPSPPGVTPAPSAPVWISTVESYKQRFGARGGMALVFDDELVSLNRALSAAGSAPGLFSVDPKLTVELEAAAPVARADWPEQDRQNRAWIAALEPALARHGNAIRTALTAIFRAPWPSTPIRVDVSRFAGPLGAFTALDPVHITISSAHPGYAGDAALEMIFHEASHALINPIERKLAAEAMRRGSKVPEDLWHALLFYSTGEIVKHRLGPSYVPYATKNGVWDRGWRGFEAALERNWRPYLNGATDLERAVAALIAAVTSAPEPARSPPR